MKTSKIVRAKIPTKTIAEFEEEYAPDVPYDGFYIYGHSIPNGLVGDVISFDECGVAFEWWVPVEEENKQFDTGLRTFDGQIIFEGDSVQPVRVSETTIKGMETIINKAGNPFIVMPNNYVYGKFIAEDIKSDTFSVNNYWLNNQLQIVSRPYDNLVEESNHDKR